MQGKDWTFVIAFCLALFVLGYFLGASVTGRVVQTMYCTDEGCFAFCSSTNDCMTGEICCERLGRGICVESANCDKEFLLSPQELGTLPPTIEQPGQISAFWYTFYLGMILLVIAIGVFYIYSRLRTIK